VFYNAYLPEIAPIELQDKVSAKGFAYGYIGSVLLQIVCFVLVLIKPFGISDGLAARLSFLLVGLWWLGFAQITFKALPDKDPAAGNKVTLWNNGLRELKKVLSEIKKMPVLKRYLSAFFFYSMGVQTVMLAATLFGSQELGLKATQLIGCILVIQLVAIGGAQMMAWLSGKFGNIKVLSFVVLVWIFICVMAYFIQTAMGYYVVATLVGIVMGGIQALSRSTYSKLMPATNDTASYFSLYDVTEKVAIVLGTFSFGLIQQLTGSMRYSTLALAIFFLIGLVALGTLRKHTPAKIRLADK
jgi:UMF1 family MFS transporter